MLLVFLLSGVIIGTIFCGLVTCDITEEEGEKFPWWIILWVVGVLLIVGIVGRECYDKCCRKYTLAGKNEIEEVLQKERLGVEKDRKIVFLENRVRLLQEEVTELRERNVRSGDTSGSHSDDLDITDSGSGVGFI